MVDYTLLKKLCLADGISGDESAVRDIIVDEIKDHAEWRVDSLGNLRGSPVETGGNVPMLILERIDIY